MDGNHGVSRGVSSRVSRGVSLEEARNGRASEARKGARGAGPYLVRSGSVYLFQIRVPQALGGGRGTRPLRVSLGPCSQREARHLAALLAAQARLRFERMLMDKGRKDGDGEDHAGVHDDVGADLRALLKVAGMGGELRLAADIASQAVPPMSAQEQARAQAWRGLVGIGREVAKGAEGNPIITDNAGVLSSQYADRLMATVSPLARHEPGAAAPVPSSGRTAASTLQAPPAPVQPPVPAVPSPAVSRTQTDHETGQDPFEDDDDDAAGYDLDRRHVRRRASRKPTFSRMAERYLAAYSTKAGEGNKDVRIARARCELFVEVIGDHPVDTYNGTDLQAWVNFLKYWPGDNNQRNPEWTAREIIEDNQDLHLAPVAYKTLVDAYINTVKRVIRWEMTKLEFSDPFAGVRLFYPATAAPPKPAQPLSAEKISAIFREGVAGGMLDEAMLPLLGQLTGRRLGLLVHLTGNDLREKYPGVWVAQTEGIVLLEGAWTRVPYKTQASTTFFVLHEFLHEIGFVEWAMSKGDGFLFPQLMGLHDPSKSASQYMRRLFERVGIESGKGEVFHSLRGGQIEDMRDAKVNGRDSRLQAGHAVGDDEHSQYGFMSLTEKRARELARLPLNPEIDYSPYRGLDFATLYQAKRTYGRRPK
jgi:integrase